MHWLADRVVAVAALAPEGAIGGTRRAYLVEVSALVHEMLMPSRRGPRPEHDAPIHVGVLGTLQQLVLVGSERKLALLRVGPVTVGILPASHVRLASTTSS